MRGTRLRRLADKPEIVDIKWVTSQIGKGTEEIKSFPEFGRSKMTINDYR